MARRRARRTAPSAGLAGSASIRRQVKPKKLLDAIATCSRAFLGSDASDVSSKAHRAFFTSHEVQRDFEGALAVIDLSDDDGYGDDEDSELLWSCVARAVSELGFPCTSEHSGDVVAFWPAEDD